MVRVGFPTVPIAVPMLVAANLPNNGAAGRETPATNDWSPSQLELLEASVVRPWGSGDPLRIRHASGSTIWDAEGAAYLDLSGSLAATAVGNCHPDVVAAIRRQAGRLMHLPADHVSEPRHRFAQAIARIAPHGLDRSAVAISGSDAIELAVRLAVAATQRRDIAVFAGGYHGNSGVARALSSRRQPADRLDAAAGVRVHHLPFPDPYRPPFPAQDYDDLASRCAAILADRMADPYGGMGPLAAVVVEPVQGSAGVVVPPATFLQRLAEICREHSSLLIADEVQTGFGRTGWTWAVERSGITPDLLVFGKGVGGGLGFAGVMGGATVMTALPSASHSSTFLTNALNLAAGSAAIDVLVTERLDERSRTLGDWLRSALHDRFDRSAHVGSIRGLGLMLGIEIVQDTTTHAPDPDRARRISELCRAEGLLIATSGRRRNVLKITPPLVVERDELSWALERLGRALSAEHG